MSFERNTVNAGRALRVLTWLVLVLAVPLWIFTQNASVFEGEDGRDFRKSVSLVLLALIIVLPPAGILAARISRRFRPWVVRHDLTWALAAVVLYAVAPFTWLVGRASALWAAVWRTRAGRFLDRHRRTVGIFLVTALSLRLFALAGLLQQVGEAAFWHWTVLGPTYLLFGATAPVIALILLVRKGEWVEVTASIWLIFGMLGVVFAALFSVFSSLPELPLLTYPLIPEPLPLSLFLSVLIADLALHIAAMRSLGGGSHAHGGSS